MIKSLRVTWCNHERVFWPVFEFIFRAFYALWAKIIVTSVFDLCTPELITNPFEEEEQRKEREKESWNLEEEKQLCSAWVWIGGFTTAFYSRIATNQCCKKKNVKKNKLYDHWISNRSMKNLREISSFPNCVLHARGENFLHQDKPDQIKNFPQ